MDRRAMLAAMADLQDAHNRQVHPRWRSQGYAYYRAIWVECAELLEHQGWKWWKQQTADLAQVKLELVDIWHFGLSDLLRNGDLETEALIQAMDVRPAPATGGETLRLAIEALAQASLALRGFPVTEFATAMAALPLSFDELYLLYLGKNVLNRFRQDHGYRTGQYRKLWDGREDNEHLIDALTDLIPGDESSGRLYAWLERRYAASA